MTTLLKCLACGETQEMHRGAYACSCGRTTARSDDTVVELRGPARVFAPPEDVTTVDGVPWMAIPEEPVLIRRAS